MKITSLPTGPAESAPHRAASGLLKVIGIIRRRSPPCRASPYVKTPIDIACGNQRRALFLRRARLPGMERSAGVLRLLLSSQNKE